MVLQERECDEQCIDPLDFEIQWHELERNNMGFIIVQKHMHQRTPWNSTWVSKGKSISGASKKNFDDHVAKLWYHGKHVDPNGGRNEDGCNWTCGEGDNNYI